MEAFAPATGAVVVTCAALTALLLAEQFLGRGTARLLGLACTFLFVAVTAGAGTLPGASDRAAPWLWGVVHAGAALGLAASAWGGTRAARRRLADPALRRPRAAARALTATALGAAGVAAAMLAAGDRLPHTTTQLLAPWLLPVAAGGLVVVVRRARRADLERRVVLVAAALAASVLLELAGGAGREASGVVVLAAIAAVLVMLVHDLGRLSLRFGGASAAEDPLTGVRTRAAALGAAEDLHRSRSPREPLAVALVALDGLGAVNDAFGQLAGDAVLRAVAGHLRAALRDEDVVGRYGGDAFVVVLPSTDEPGGVLALDRAIEAVREAELGTWAHKVRLTATAGLAAVGAGERAVDAALAEADRAYERGRAAGGDRVVSAAVAARAPLPTPRRAGAGPQAA